MTNNIRWGLDNPHPFSQVKTELIWEGKYDEYGNRRTVDIAGCAMPLQKIETIDEPASRAMVPGSLFDPVNAHQDRELSDPELTEQALIQWTSGLHRIWSCH